MSGKNLTHPYHPQSLQLPHYVPNDKSVVNLLGTFFGVVGVFLVLTWIYTGHVKQPRFSIPQRIVLCWFVMCGIIHTVLEGYFSFFHATLAGESTFLAQMWKEYSKGDSRYVSSDTFVLCMETITAVVDGPLCFLTVMAFIKHSPFRYVLQLIVSLCQLYGDTLYFMTEIKEDFAHGEMWHPLYFWFYFVFLNMLWIIIPFSLILHASWKLAQSQMTFDNKPVPVKRNKKAQ